MKTHTVVRLTSFAGYAVLLLVLVLMFMPMQAAWAADSPPEAPVIPDAVEMLIGAAVTFVVVAGLKDFAKFIGKDLTGWGTVIAAALTAIVVFTLNTLLQVAVTMDPSLVPKVQAFFQILLILLGAMGFKTVAKGSYTQ